MAENRHKKIFFAPGFWSCGLITFFIVFFPLNAYSDVDLEVYMKDEGLQEGNISKPRIYIKNTGSEAIVDFEMRYYFNTKDGKTPVIDEYYTPNCDVTLKSRDGENNYYISYSYTGTTLNPGDILPNMSGNVVGIHYPGWTNYNAGNDYSNDSSSIFKLNNKITVYQSGNIVYGVEPSEDNQYNGPEDITLSNNHIEEHMEIESPVGAFKAEYSGSYSGGFNYTLVSGPGSEDNDAFQIKEIPNGSGIGYDIVLSTSTVYTYEERKDFNIRVKCSDQNANSFEKQFKVYNHEYKVISQKWVNLETGEERDGNNPPEDIYPETETKYFDVNGNIIEEYDGALVNKTLITYELDYIKKRLIKADGKTYYHLNVPGLKNQNGSLGMPSIPCRSVCFNIPENKEIKSIDISTDIVKTLSGHEIYPEQMIKSNQSQYGFQDFKKNENFYSSDEIYPENYNMGDKQSYMRSYKLHELDYSLIKYNASNQNISIAKRGKIEVEYSNNVINDFINLVSAAFKRFFERLNDISSNGEISNPEKYLILMDNQFLGNEKLDKFIEWKRRKGYEVDILLDTDIDPEGDPSYEEIKNTLQTIPDDQYPEYLLIIGDGDLKEYEIDGIKPCSSPLTDLYYACRNDDDIIPDLFFGRLPAGDNQELSYMLDKVLLMDRYTPAHNNYDDITVACHTDGINGDNVLTHSYLETADAVSSYFKEDPFEKGFNVTTAYEAVPALNESTKWSPWYLLWENTTETIGERIVSLIDERIYNNFSIEDTNSAAVNKIKGSLNTGTSILLHTSHGCKNGFNHPGFKQDGYNYHMVEGLRNENHLPLIFSLNCESGYYFKNPGYFSRKFLNVEPDNDGMRGAYGIVAATGLAWSCQYITHGIFASFNEDWFEWFNTTTSPVNWSGRLNEPAFSDRAYLNLKPNTAKNLGQMMHFARIYYMREKNMNNEMFENTYLRFHLFGDPSADIHFNQPERIPIEHRHSVSSDKDSIIVLVGEGAPFTGKEGARVSLYSPDSTLSVHKIGFTNLGGRITFPVDLNKNKGVIHVTVSGPDIFPYEGEIIVGDKAFNNVFTGYGLYGFDKVDIHDRVKCHLSSSSYFTSGCYNTIDESVITGVNSDAGTILSNGGSFLRDRSNVYGDIVCGGTIKKQNTILITGEEIENTEISTDTLPQKESITYNIPKVEGREINVTNGDSISLKPGVYDIWVEAGSTLRLSKGIYFFSNFDVSPDSKLYPTGKTELYIQDYFELDGTVIHKNSEGSIYSDSEAAENLFIGYTGIRTLFLDYGINGTVVSPKADIQIGQVSDQTFRGMFIGDKVIVHQDSEIWYVPFEHGENSAVTMYDIFTE